MNIALSEESTSSYFTEDQATDVQKALLERPKFSIRLRIILIFLVTFALTCAIIIADMIFISNLSKQQEFLEKAANFEFEIQQARRFEKNYFLYGTNLYDALEHVHNAENMKENFKEKMIHIIGNHAFNNMSYNLKRYKESLEKLRNLSGESDPLSGKERLLVESEIRNFGAAIIADAANAIDQERLRMHSWMDTSMISAVTVLVIILIIGIFLTTYITRQILHSYKRFEDYTNRIAKGDFSLITPARKYRDEFSNLAIALNHMLIELKNREEQLLQSGKMAAVGTLTAGIAHELNNPLNNISLITESLIDDFDEWDNEQKLKMLKDIIAQVERMGATVANLLDFTHRDKSSFEQISINDVLNRTLKFVANEIHVNKVQLDKDMAANLPKIFGNQHHLQQVFLNVFLNAIQAMPDGGELKVKSYVENNAIKIDIIDTGVGISQEIREKIFDPFFTTRAVGEGTGLGLSVSYGIIKQHHGEISVESELGHGSKFSIILPISRGEQVERGY
jgi:two-component system NtrC family sensor kinase